MGVLGTARRNSFAYLFCILLFCTAASANPCLGYLAEEAAFKTIEKDQLELEDWKSVSLSFSVLRDWMEKELRPSDQLPALAALHTAFMALPEPKLIVASAKSPSGFKLVSMAAREPWEKVRSLWVDALALNVPRNFAALMNFLEKELPQDRAWRVIPQALITGLRELDPHTFLEAGETFRRRQNRVESFARQNFKSIKSTPARLVSLPSANDLVTWSISSYGNKKLGILRIKDFSTDKVLDLTRRALKELKRRNVEGMVLDLRHNPGGLVSTAIDIASLFIGEQPRVLSEIPLKEGWSPVVHASHLPKEVDVPLVVLVDKLTISAAEILAGVLRAFNRAYLVGDRTYGKATVQRRLFTLKEPGFLKGHDLVFTRTTHMYAFRTGESPQKNGVVPDIQSPNVSSVKISERSLPNAFPNFFLPMEQPARDLPERVERCRRLKEKSLDASGKDANLVFALDILDCLI